MKVTGFLSMFVVAAAQVGTAVYNIRDLTGPCPKVCPLSGSEPIDIATMTVCGTEIIKRYPLCSFRGYITWPGSLPLPCSILRTDLTHPLYFAFDMSPLVLWSLVMQGGIQASSTFVVDLGAPTQQACEYRLVGMTKSSYSTCGLDLEAAQLQEASIVLPPGSQNLEIYISEVMLFKSQVVGVVANSTIDKCGGFPSLVHYDNIRYDFVTAAPVQENDSRSQVGSIAWILPLLLFFVG